MRYVPEELYLTWKERAEVSRRYASALLKDHEEISKRLSTLHVKCWAQENEIQHLKRIPHNKLNNRLHKTQQRLFWAKHNARNLQAKLDAITDVLKNEDGSL